MVVEDQNIFQGVKNALEAFAINTNSSFDSNHAKYKLIGLAPNSDESKYTLLISSSWLDRYEDEFEVYDALIPYLSENLAGILHKIDNILVINSQDSLVDEIKKFRDSILIFGEKSPEYLILHDIRIGQNEVEKLYLLQC